MERAVRRDAERDGPLNAAVWNYCHEKELERGKRLTHQEVMVDTLKQLIGFSGDGPRSQREGDR